MTMLTVPPPPRPAAARKAPTLEASHKQKGRLPTDHSKACGIYMGPRGYGKSSTCTEIITSTAMAKQHNAEHHQDATKETLVTAGRLYPVFRKNPRVIYIFDPALTDFRTRALAITAR
jgi:hypothetical protein